MNDEIKGTEIVEAPQEQISLGQLMFNDPGAMMAQAKIVATTLKSIIKDQELVSIISGREYVVVEGWTTMGAMIGVIPRTVSVKELTVEYELGNWTVFEADVELVRTSDGFIVGRGIAECGHPDEVDKKGNPVWANRPRYAKKSMAITRATGKAFRLSYSWIIKMAGYSPTPAEEMDNLGSFNNESTPENPAEVRVPFKKAKELFGGEQPTIAELFAKDPEYCDWIYRNVDESDVGDAMRAFIDGQYVTEQEVKLNGDPETGEVIEGEIVEDKLSVAEEKAIAMLESDHPNITPKKKHDWGPAYAYVDGKDDYSRKDLVKLVNEHGGDVRIGMCYLLGYL